MTETLIKLFLPIITGYIVVKSGYVKPELGKDLKFFVIRVTVPALVFMAMYNTDVDTLKQLVPVAMSYVIITAILILLSFLLLFKIKDKRLKATYIVTIVWGNYGWMGWAVLKEALGEEGFSRGVFFTALWWPVLYAGSFLVSKLTKTDSRLDIKSYVVNMLIPLIALLSGILLNILKVNIPEPVTYTLTKFGEMTVTIILFSVGLSISLKKSLENFRQSLIPIFLRPILGFVAGIITINIIGFTDEISKNSVMIESTMPVAIFTVVIGDMLGLDEKLMSSILILSTLLSIITIPLTLTYLFY